MKQVDYLDVRFNIKILPLSRTVWSCSKDHIVHIAPAMENSPYKKDGVLGRTQNYS